MSEPKFYLPAGVEAPEGLRRAPKQVWTDKRITYSENGEKVEFSPEDVLKAAARMLRDGYSLKRIKNELGVEGLVSDKVLERAIVNVGMPLLNRDIARGTENAESKFLIDAADAPLRVDEVDD